MKKFLGILMGVLIMTSTGFSAITGGGSTQCFDNTAGKGSWKITVKSDNAKIFKESSNVSKNTAATPAIDVICVRIQDTDGTPGTVTPTADATFPGAIYYAVELDDTKNNSVEVQLSGKLTGFSSETSGNGNGYWRWSGTSSLDLDPGMPEIHGLTNLDSPYGKCTTSSNPWCEHDEADAKAVYEAACSVTCGGGGGA